MAGGRRRQRISIGDSQVATCKQADACSSQARTLAAKGRTSTTARTAAACVLWGLGRWGQAVRSSGGGRDGERFQLGMSGDLAGQLLGAADEVESESISDATHQARSCGHRWFGDWIHTYRGASGVCVSPAGSSAGGESSCPPTGRSPDRQRGESRDR